MNRFGDCWQISGIVFRVGGRLLVRFTARDAIGSNQSRTLNQFCSVYYPSSQSRILLRVDIDFLETKIENNLAFVLLKSQ